MVVSHRAQPFLIDATTDEEHGDHQPADCEHGVHQERPVDPSTSDPAVTTSAVFKPRPMDPPAIWNM